MMCCNKRKLIDNCAVVWKGASSSFLKLYVAYPALENYPRPLLSSGRALRAKEGYVRITRHRAETAQMWQGDMKRASEGDFFCCWRSFHFYSVQHNSISSIAAVRIPAFFLIYPNSSCQMAFPFCTMTHVIIRQKGKLCNWEVKDSVNQ